MNRSTSLSDVASPIMQQGPFKQEPIAPSSVQLLPFFLDNGTCKDLWRL
jgi:hypothetical protein